MAPKKMTEYERKRLENIKKNDEMMAALKIRSHLSQLSSVSKRNRPQSKSYKSSPEKKQKSAEPVVLRRSLRTRGGSPTFSGLKDDFDETPSKESPNTNSKSVFREPVPISMRDAYRGDGSDSVLVDLMKSLSVRTQIDDTHVASVDLDALDLKPENVARVVPGRIMNVKFFPTTDRTLVVVGNKFGNVGFWNVDAQEDNGNGIYMYYPHTAPVSGIVIQPFSMSKMFTSSYDGFIRLMDVEKEIFDFIYSSDYAVFSLSGRPHDLNSLYFSEGSGEFDIWDLRAGKSPSTWNLHEARINTIDFNSENTNLMATSSTDGTACIWDLRNINADKPRPLTVVRHDRAVHSAYFSPSGSFLATTCIDDKVGLLSGANFEEISMIYHYNQTGRWLSTFRGIWGWDDSYLYIGNMKRGIDVISVSEKKTTATLQSENVTAIPCRFDVHRYRVGMLAAATSGGQVYVWTSS